MEDVYHVNRDSIMDALQSKNIAMLQELVPSLSAEEAQSYIDVWEENYLATMSKIRNSQDTSAEVDRTYEILNDLVEKAHSSNRSR